jgi:diguanylate cyclase (GGDEF)-like protein/PAS domain S-box-containing protein
MRGWHHLRRQWPLAVTYWAAGATALGFTRYEGGVAFLWGATAILIAALLRTSRKRWLAPLAICGAISTINTGLLGAGWAGALPFTVVNLSEAVVGALLLRRMLDPAEVMRSLGWFVRYVGVVGLAAPLVSSAMAAVALVVAGHYSASGVMHFFTGHSLGNLTFTPLALLLTGQRPRQQTVELLRRNLRDALLIMALVVVVATAVFAQDKYPLLFLPVPAVILATFRLGRVGAATAVALLAIVGGILTAVGSGPLQLASVNELGERMQFFQFYLAATVLTVLPVSAHLHAGKQLLKRVRISEERFRLMAEHSSDLLMHIGADGRFRYVSPSMWQIGGYDPQALVGTFSSDLVAPEHLAEVRRAHWATMEQPGETSSYQFTGIMADGSRRWFETHSRAMIDEEGRPDGVLSISRDITAVRARVEQLSTAAMTDTLTGLPNRRALLNEVAERRWTGERSDCIAMLDVDHFKQVNDLHGHQAGDEVLKGLAGLVRGMLRAGDLPARLGGEEFAILFADTTPEQALQICERLREQVAATPVPTSRGPIRVTISGGVAALDGRGIEAALKTADRALYKAKHCGRDQFRMAA